MKDILELLKNTTVLTAILIVMILIIILAIFLIYRHWKVFTSLFNLSANIDTMIAGQTEMKAQHVAISKEVEKIAKEVIPNGSNKIRFVYDSIENIEKDIKIVLDQQQISNFKQASKLEIDKNPFFECNSKGMCISANSALCNLFGSTQDQMSGEGWGKFIIDRDQERVFRNWHRALLSKQHELIDAFTILNPLKKIYKNIEYKVVFKYNENGELSVIIGTFWEQKNRRHEDNMECLYEMAGIIKKSSMWKEIQAEVKSKTS